MLTSYQVQIVAYVSQDGETICHSCVAKIDDTTREPNVHTPEWTAVMRYDLEADEDYEWTCGVCGTPLVEL